MVLVDWDLASGARSGAKLNELRGLSQCLLGAIGGSGATTGKVGVPGCQAVPAVRPAGRRWPGKRPRPDSARSSGSS